MVLTGLALTAAAGGKKVRYQGELAGGIALEPKSTSPDKWYEITIRHGVRLFDYLFVGAGFSYIARVGTPIDREFTVFGTVGGCLPLGKAACHSTPRAMRAMRPLLPSASRPRFHSPQAGAGFTLCAE